jgi:nucleotide-binding universal stress UspA family protein
MYKKILVPLDGSPKAALALEAARQLLEPEHSELHLLVAVNLGQVLFADRQDKLPKDFERLGEQQMHEAGAYLTELQGQLASPQITCHTRVEQADPREAIVNYCKDHGIELVVMTSFSKSKLERWVTGSVADQVLRASPCPVMIVRPTQSSAS